MVAHHTGMNLHDETVLGGHLRRREQHVRLEGPGLLGGYLRGLGPPVDLGRPDLGKGRGVGCGVAVVAGESTRRDDAAALGPQRAQVTVVVAGVDVGGRGEGLNSVVPC